jgi:uncharacterized protein
MKKYIRERLRTAMQLDDPPSKLALAFALGVFIAFSPWLGFHIISCFLFAWVFRVSKFVVLTAAFINNPWTMVPMYAFCIWIGITITGESTAVPQIAWNELTFTTTYSILRPYLWSYLIGTLLVGAVAAVISYFIFYWAVVRYRKREKR